MPWFNAEILKSKKGKRKKELLWSRLRTDARNARNNENRLLIRRKRECYRQKAEEAGFNINKLNKLLKNLTGSKKKKNLPEGFADDELANKFLIYFANKMQQMVDIFQHDDSTKIRSIMW